MPLFTSAADTPNDISHLSLHDALPILGAVAHHRDHRLVGIGELGADGRADADAETARAWRAETGPRLLEGHITQDQRIFVDRKSTRLNSSHPSISYAVFCLKKKNCIVC